MLTTYINVFNRISLCNMYLDIVIHKLNTLFDREKTADPNIYNSIGTPKQKIAYIN